MEIKVSVVGVELTCDVDYIAGSPDYFDRAFGNWLPGDSEECIVNSIHSDDDLYELICCSHPMELVEDACRIKCGEMQREEREEE